MLSETTFQALIKVTREVTPTGKQLRIHYKQSIISSENPFLTALNTITVLIVLIIPNRINNIREEWVEEEK